MIAVNRHDFTQQAQIAELVKDGKATIRNVGWTLYVSLAGEL